MNNITAYSSTETNSLQGAELEASALIKCASELNYVKENWEGSQKLLDEALEKNRKLWVILTSSMVEPDCKQPPEIKSNITNLAMFIFQRTIDIMIDPKPQSLKVLIDINMNIAQGLGGKA